jgi:tripeptidyl-peptidase-1
MFQVEAFVAPTQDTVVAVDSWLKSNNLSSSPITAAGDWISVSMTAAQANQLLGAEFSAFQNQETNQTVDRTLFYSIPDTLKGSINAVYPTVTSAICDHFRQQLIFLTASLSSAIQVY